MELSIRGLLLSYLFGCDLYSPSPVSVFRVKANYNGIADVLAFGQRDNAYSRINFEAGCIRNKRHTFRGGMSPRSPRSGDFLPTESPRMTWSAAIFTTVSLIIPATAVCRVFNARRVLKSFMLANTAQERSCRAIGSTLNQQLMTALQGPLSTAGYMLHYRSGSRKSRRPIIGHF